MVAAMTTAAVAANLGGVALFALPGLGVAEIFAPLARLAWWRRLGYGYLLGVVAVGGLLFAASHFLGVPLRRPAITAAVLLPMAAGAAARFLRSFLRRRQRLQHCRRGAPPASPGASPAMAAAVSVAPGRRLSAWRQPWDTVAALVAGAVGAGILVSALSVPLADWDGRMIWSALADYMRHEATASPSVLGDPHWFVMHPRYPPLLPVAQAAVQETFGAAPDEQLYRAFYAAFFAAMLLVLRDGAGRAAGGVAAALATLSAALPHFLGYGAGGATSAYSDLPLAAFYGGGLILLLLAPRRPALGLAAGCLLAGAVLAKNEGTLLAAAALLLAAGRLLSGVRRGSGRPGRRPGPPDPPGPSEPSGPSGPSERASRQGIARILGWFAAAALPVLAAATLLASWRAAIPNRFDEDYFAVVRLPSLLHNAVALLPAICREIARLSFRASDWQGFWIAFLAVLAAGLPALRRPGARLMLLAGVVPAAVAWAAYCETTPLDNLAPFISETWPRFLVQGLVPLTIAFACALRLLLRRAAPVARMPAAILAPDAFAPAADDGSGGGNRLPGDRRPPAAVE
jgi:hypothetical protein